MQLLFNTIFNIFAYSAFFRFLNHILKLKTLDQPQSTGWVFWHIILHSYFATLCVSFSSKSKASNVFPKNILKSKAHDKSIQARKKIFCHLIVKTYLCNVLRKVLIKIESTWRREIKEQAPQLTLLFCGRTVKKHLRTAAFWLFRWFNVTWA